MFASFHVELVLCLWQEVQFSPSIWSTFVPLVDSSLSLSLCSITVRVWIIAESAFSAGRWKKVSFVDLICLAGHVGLADSVGDSLVLFIVTCSACLTPGFSVILHNGTLLNCCGKERANQES